jgi:heterotetrameric sarcosine oxidase gamma subunit
VADAVLSPNTTLSGIPQTTGAKGGVSISERDDLGLATMHVRKGQATPLNERIRTHFLITLPTGPACASAGDVAFIGTGPGCWLAIRERGGHEFSASLRQITSPLASVSDQSGGYTVLRVSGRYIRQTLAKGFAIDLDPTVFKIGDAATTLASHIGATIWRREDDADGLPVFDIAIFRSLAHSFWQWFSESAAEFGCELGEQAQP